MLATASAQQRTSSISDAPKWHTEQAKMTRAANPRVDGPTLVPEADELQVITTRAGLETLEAEWNDLFEEAARDTHVFQTFNWIWHWANHFLPAGTGDEEDCGLFIIAGRRSGRLVLLCPFVRQRRAGLTILGFAGDPVGQYGDVLVDPARGGRDLLERAWNVIIETAGIDVLSFRKVRADSNIAPLLAEKGATVTERQLAPFLDLTTAPDYETYEKRYSSKARKNRRRLLRRFEERSPATIARYTSGTRAGELAALAVSLKRAWLKHRGLVSRALANPATREFFSTVATAAERPVGAVITSLETRGESAALEVAFDCKGRRAVHIIVYALKFERASVGQLLIEQSVRDAMHDGLRIYDLMAPADAYKLDWADGSIEVADWAYGLSPRGHAFAKLYLTHARRSLKAALNTTTRLVRRLKAGQSASRE